MDRQDPRIYEFGDFRIDPAARQLSRQDKVIAITPKAFDLLLALAQNSGEVVSKDELMNRVWPDTFVEESNLTFTISVLRKALAEASNGASFIETVPRRGYRFTADVRQPAARQPSLIVEKLTVANFTIEREEREVDDDITANHLGYAKSLTLTDAPLPATARQFYMKTVSRKLLLAGGLLVTVLAALLVWRILEKAKPASPVPVNSIAVLPFKLVNAEDQEDYLGLGLTDALISRLGHSQQLIVRPTSAVRKYAAQEQDSIAIGKALLVDAVLEGSIQKYDNRLRVTVQLLRVSDGRHLWTETFDETFTGIFAVEDAISSRCANALALKLLDQEKALLTRHYTENVEAYQLYMKGRYLWNKRNAADMQKGITYFQQAIALDPNYALAYCGLADSYAILPSIKGTSTQAYAALARDAARQAIALDNSLAQAHTSLAAVLEYFDWQRETADQEYERALELNPNDAIARHRYGVHLTSLGRFEEAVAQLRRAQELDPLSLATAGNLAWVSLCQGEFEQAIEQCKKILEIDDKFLEAKRIMAFAYELQGKDEEAVTAYLEIDKLLGRNAQDLLALQSAFQTAGRKGYWQKRLAMQMAESSTQKPSPVETAFLYARLGDRENTFLWLERACQERDGEVVWLKVAPDFRSFHQEARFADLLRRVGFY